MELYEVFPMPDVDYLRLKLDFLVGKTVEGIYWHDPEKDRIRIYLRTYANPYELRRFFSLTPVKEDEIPVPTYVADVRLAKEKDFYAPIKFNNLSNFVLELPKGYQMRIWISHDPMLKRILSERLERKNVRLSAPEQLAANLLKRPIYLVKVYLLGDNKNVLRAMVRSLVQLIVTESGKLDADIRRTRGFLSKWKDTAPSVGLFGYFSEPRKWLWAVDEDFSALLVMPTTGKVKLAVSADLPYVRYDRKDFLIGRDILYDEDVYLDWTDFQRHALILGTTGSGKSNTLEVLAQELMKYGLVVFVDPNSQSARKLSKLAKFYFTIGGPNQDPNFGINILKIPPYFKNRDEAVDYVVDKAVQLFKKMLNLTENAVYVLFIVKVVLRALLKKYDEITFEDFYETLLALWNEEIDINELMSPEDRRAASELQFIQELQSQTFASVLARLEDFVNNRKFRIITSQNTIDWDRIMEMTGGKGLIVFDVGKGENEDLAVSVMGLIAISLFNYVYLRDVLRREPKPIFLMVDEAHNITHFDFIPLIFKEARKYGLHLILATQTFASIVNTAGSANAAEINNNTNVKILMKAGDPLEVKLESDMVGGTFANTVKNMLTQLAIGQAFLILTPRPGEMQVPKLVQIRKSELTLEGEREPTKGFEPNVSRISKVGHPIRVFFARDYPFNPIQQRVLFLVTANNGRIDQLTLLKLLGIDKNKLDNDLQKLAEIGLIEITEGQVRGKQKVKLIVLKERMWPLTGLKSLATSKEGLFIAVNVLLHYISQGYYVVPTRQSPDILVRPDLVAVKFGAAGRLNYDDNVAIEIISPAELIKSSQEVIENLRKYFDPSMSMVKEVHVWTTADAFPKLKEMYDILLNDPAVPEDYKQKVRIFAVGFKDSEDNEDSDAKESGKSSETAQSIEDANITKPAQTEGEARNNVQVSAISQPLRGGDTRNEVQSSVEGATRNPEGSGTSYTPSANVNVSKKGGVTEIEIDGVRLTLYKSEGVVEIDGKKYRVPPYVIDILRRKDEIAEILVDDAALKLRMKNGLEMRVPLVSP